MAKPWTALTAEVVDATSAQLGVYQIADEAGTVVKIGYAGGTQPFGMRSALASELADASGRVQFRIEFTHGYLTRWQELLMIHQSDHGTLPPGNADRDGKLGRLSPLPEGASR